MLDANRHNQLLGAEEILVPAEIFDPVWYVSTHELETSEDHAALDHFVSYGFELGLNPAPLVDIDFVRSVGKSYGWQINSATALFATLGAVAADSPIGWSARFIPSWIRLQLGPSSAEAGRLRFIDLLRSQISVNALSPHPALHPSKPLEIRASLKDVLVSLTSDHHVIAWSRIDLGEYVSQHRDLTQNLAADARAFDHAWSVGLSQNRLKYLGVTAPRSMTHDQLVRRAIISITQSSVRSKTTEADRGQSQLPVVPLVKFAGEPLAIDACLSYDPTKAGEPPKFEDLITILACADSTAMQILKPPVQSVLSSFMPCPTLRREILDTDLMNGHVKEDAGRVVYSINLGLYDHTPVPPMLDDCAFYLITDACNLPTDLPWRVVRPTISERDRKRQCLWYKTHPHLLFPQAENSVWIDANVECLPGSERVLMAQETLAEVATFIHPDRDCIYEEAEEISRLGLDHPETIQACVKRLREAGMPVQNGLFETNVLYSKPADYAVRNFYDTWWRNIFLGSRRDQMSFTFAAFLTGVLITPLDNRHNTKTSRFFRKRPHRQLQGRKL